MHLTSGFRWGCIERVVDTGVDGSSLGAGVPDFYEVENWKVCQAGRG